MRIKRIAKFGIIGAVMTMVRMPTAYCVTTPAEPPKEDEVVADKKVDEAEVGVDKPADPVVNSILAMLGPILGKISYGSCLGGCAGYALKKMTKAAAMAIGGVFLFLQVLAYKGYIFVDWQKVEKDVVSRIDQDGDGDFDGDDVKILVANMWDFVKFQLPSASGFGLGFVAGFKYG